MSTNTLISSRPAVGKTQKAIEICIDKISTGINGVYFCLEMDDTLLIERILGTADKKDISFEKGCMRHLYINITSDSLAKIIQYVGSSISDEKLDFIIVDYIQLLDIDRDYKKFFDYMASKDIDVYILSQIKRGMEPTRAVWEECVLGVRWQDDGFLEYIDEGYFLTESHGEIYCENKDRQSM